MIAAIASGKGGTGKTTVTAALAATWDTPVTAMDLDVEEPNLHLFLNPEFRKTSKAYIEVPRALPEKCTDCRACVELCQFKAVTVMAGNLLVFPEMCHGCGGCMAVCPEKALVPDKRELGEILVGKAGEMDFVMGRSRIGEAMTPPLMRQVKDTISDDNSRDVLLDSPPGVSCPAMNAVMDADCVVLVSEPTPFGLHDFTLAWKAFAPLGKPMGAVINRWDAGDNRLREFCMENNIPIWAEIPQDRAIAEAYSNGRVIAEACPELVPVFENLRRNIRKAAGGNHA